MKNWIPKNFKWYEDKSCCLTSSSNKWYWNDWVTTILQIPRWKNKWWEKALDWKTPCLSSNQWNHNNVLFVREATKKWYIEVNDGECFDATHRISKTRRGRSMKEKSNCMTSGGYDFMRFKEWKIRKLAPIECERLQWVPDHYTDCVSDSQAYKMLWNWWNIETIVHILKEMLWKSNDTKQKFKNILNQ